MSFNNMGESSSEAKLPKWVQLMLVSLRSENASLKAVIDRTAGDVVESRVSQVIGIHKSKYLSEDTITFELVSKGKRAIGRDRHTRVDVKLRDSGILEIYGDDALVIYPTSTSSIKLKVAKL